ncbi:hypothetical protein EZV61_19320 [Corallincola luteus]|uniref:Uncharacterized protein n=1 Tax=Corallincola luteus TaxID=1775177 RepID=A0ABY2AFG8_9GAMM|nr:hypothetical protein [Corallincola luteus]TCI01078.1 hypothetical protein EZV61_19320 [Corallincola luteus]
MKSADGVPPQKQFYIGVLVTLFIVFVSLIFTNDDKDDRFRLLFSGFHEGEIERINIKIGNSIWDIVNPQLKLSTLDRKELKFIVPNELGFLNLTLWYDNGKKYSLSNIEYRAGESNYITLTGDKIINVKAHWQ